MGGKDGNWIAAGVVAAVVVPLLSFLGVPFPIAVVIALVAFAGIVLLLAPRRLFEGLDMTRIGKHKVAFAQELLTDAAPAVDRLHAVASGIEDPGVEARVRRLATMAEDVVAKVEANPASVSSVKRFLGYYLPRAADIAEGYAAIEEKHNPDPARLGEIATVIGKLETAFAHYADSLVESELGTLDIDMKLIQASLKEDIGP
jgi:5-bromo-4-chloroindolyl phosphate hydrolysis protein